MAHIGQTSGGAKDGQTRRKGRKQASTDESFVALDDFLPSLPPTKALVVPTSLLAFLLGF
jgi:hypothetical protein